MKHTHSFIPRLLPAPAAAHYLGVSNLISDAASKIGSGKTAHGLRATRLTLIAEAGGSTQAIMAWGGHVTISEAEGYTRKANRRALLIGVENKKNVVAGDNS